MTTRVTARQRKHATEDNDGACWCDPSVLDYLDGRREIVHRGPATHVLPTDDEEDSTT
jgi:hypothetical protein